MIVAGVGAVLMAATILALAEPVAAQPADAIVVTGSRTRDAGFGETVIDTAEIDLLQPLSSLDLLDRVAGVRAFGKGGAAGASYLGIRGGEPNFTLVLLDGVKVTDPTNSRGGAFDFGQIDPLALERIEIARGGLSAVHGADALSGIVNLRLRTLEPGEDLASARLLADSRGGFGASLIGGHGWSDGALLGGASWTDSGDLTETSDIDRSQIFARVSQEVAGASLSALGLRGRADRETFPEDSGGPLLAVVRERERRRTGLDLASLTLSGPSGRAWQPRLALHWSRQRNDADTPPIAPGPVLDGVPAIRSDSRFQRVEALFDNRLELGGSAELAFGAAYLHDRGSSTGTIDFGVLIPADFRLGRGIVSGFAEASVRPAATVAATFGIRYDDPSTARGEWTGRAALRWTPAEGGPALVGSWAEGYKLPSLYALAYPIIANPDLLPERSRTFDLGLEQGWAGGSGRARLAFFHSRYADLIDFDPATFTNVNRARVVAKGVEAELETPLAADLGLRANLTYTDTDGAEDAPPLRSRPDWQGLLALAWRPSERLRMEASGAYTGAFFDSSVPTGLVTLDARLLLGAAAQYRLSDAVTLTASADNLLGKRFQEAVGFPGAGQVIRVGVTLRGL
jgi:outer membrane cobalamin receptor